MSQPPHQEGTLQPYPYSSQLAGQIGPPPPAQPSKAPDPFSLLVSALNALVAVLSRIPGVGKTDAYMYDDRGITAGNPTLDINVYDRLGGKPATSGYVIADSATIKMVINKKGTSVTLNTGETFTLRPDDPLAISNLYFTTASATAGIRVFMS